MCVPDAAGNVFVWAHPGGQLVHFLPALNELVLSLAFTVNTDALVTATWQKASVSCLTKPTVDDVLAMWMGSSYELSACTEITRQLLRAYPSLPNNVVCPLTTSAAGNARHSLQYLSRLLLVIREPEGSWEPEGSCC